jgi:hypothetical protein
MYANTLARFAGPVPICVLVDTMNDSAVFLLGTPQN